MRNVLRRLGWAPERMPSRVLAIISALSAMAAGLTLVILIPVRPLVSDGLASRTLSWEALVVVAIVTVTSIYSRAFWVMARSSGEVLCRRWLGQAAAIE